MRKFILTSIACLGLWLTSHSVMATEDARMLRYPDINGKQIVFVFAGDIWTVDAQGGDAHRLTSHKGLELFPKISPDGKWIAFSAEYSGNRQVYVMPSQGGTPRQLTYYNDAGAMPPRGGFDNVVLGWTPNSEKVLYRGNRTPYGERMGKYFTVSILGGMEEALPIPYGGFGVLSPDGKKLVFAYIDREFRTWKRYKGGRASDLWIYDLEKNTSEQITDFKGTDHIPTWYKDKVFFASDRDLWLNIYSYDVNSKQVSQITKHTKYDVMWPSGSNGQLAYENGGYLFKLNLETGKSDRVIVNINYDYAGTLPYLKNVKDFIHSTAISPSGNRVLIDARGDIFSVPAGEGTTRNLTHTQGVRAVYPSWSPDGKMISWMDDRTGEYEVYVMENKEGAEARQLTSNSKGWKYQGNWSPDSRYILFFDRSLKLQIIDVVSGKLSIVDSAESDELTDFNFSPDSKWIAYSKQNASGQSSIWVYEIATAKKNQVTDDTFNDGNPVFSKDGQYLFFISNRDFNLEFSSFEFNYLYNNAARIYALPLTTTAPKLFAPKETEETVAEAPKAEDNKSKDKAKGEAAKPAPSGVQVSIDFNRTNERIVAFPLPSGNYWGLQATKDGLVYLSEGGLNLFNLKENKSDLIMAGIFNAQLCADGSKFLYQQGQNYGVASLSPGQKAGDGLLKLDDLTMTIEPLKEWQQIFRDGWRIYRDFYYVSNMHNVDYQGLYEKYAEMIPYMNHRFDLDYIIGEFLGETNTGHAYHDYGDFERVERIETGLLGADLATDANAGRYKISKIYQGENWNPERRSPLTEQGIDIKEGEYLISIDGFDVTTKDNPYKYLVNKVDKATVITVNSQPSKQGARSYTIRPIKSELELFSLDWVNSRRALVDKLSGGKIGYIYVPNTAIEGNRELHRGMYAYHDKEALIIDDRFNGGGFIPDRMIEILSRQTHAYWNIRGMAPMRTPGIAHDGPKAMLINQYSSSGGDAFPYFFRQKNLGTIIGTRTWGGLVGMSGNARLMDGGYVGAPRFGIYNQEGEWIIEGEGVYPDIEVIDAPHLIALGQDPCIEKAVEVLLKQLEQNPPKPWKVPAEPDRSGWIQKDIK